MKKYIEPALEVERFDVADVITTSNTGFDGDASTGGTGNDSPFGGN